MTRNVKLIFLGKQKGIVRMLSATDVSGILRVKASSEGCMDEQTNQVCFFLVSIYSYSKTFLLDGSDSLAYPAECLVLLISAIKVDHSLI